MPPSGALSKKSDDLFEKSSMSFGEHLEELRRALAKSMVWLVAGMLISLTFASSIINYVESPLRAALDQFYRDKANKEWKRIYKSDMPSGLREWMKNQEFTPEIVFEFDAALQPPSSATSPSPASTTSPTPSAPADSSSLATQSSPPTPSIDVWIPKDVSAEQLVPKWQFRKTATNTDALSITEPFMIYLKAGLVSGLVLASPGIFWHIWGFISAGLYPHERRYVYFFLPASVILFVGGASLAFFGVFHYVLHFLLGFNASLGIDAAPRLNDYMSFALLLPLGFGVAFQLPLVMLILERLGICTTQMYLSQWRWAMLIIAFLSMILTPGDITPMIAMMIPLVGLYFLGIAMCKYLPRGTALGTEGYDAA